MYTPTVGVACERFSEIYRRPRGLFVSYPDRDRLAEVIDNRPHRSPDVIVVTDGQRILGHPYHYLCPGEPLLGVKPEALEGEIAEIVEDTRVAGREERSGEVFLLVA